MILKDYVPIQSQYDISVIFLLKYVTYLPMGDVLIIF